ncbi:hypothetical protein [Pontibacter kalidii]|uniref:hypothetical protein n=1 Tax=Pontibacter kalidii TaxID=2592049 RepID=UPI0022500E20|nr:hypothetical protein [Pontibacter kalidii]
MAGVKVDIQEVGPEIINVRVGQKELKNGFLHNQRQLVSRAAKVLAPLMGGQHRIHYTTLTFKPDFAAVTTDWLKERLAEFRLSRNDLIKQSGLGKEVLSRIMSGAEPPAPHQQAVLYYYFMVHELNHSTRAFLASDDTPAADL